MKVPANPVDATGPLGHEVPSVIDQQTDLAGCLIVVGGGQVRLAQGRPRDSQRVDGVRLSLGPSAIA